MKIEEPAEGYVLAATKGKEILSSGYYQGDGEWGQEDSAKIYYTKAALRKARVRAFAEKPERADDVCGFAVYLP